MPTVYTKVQCQIDYWATLNSKQDLCAPSVHSGSDLQEQTTTKAQTAGYTGQLGWWELHMHGYISVLNKLNNALAGSLMQYIANRLPFNCSCFYTK